MKELNKQLAFLASDWDTQDYLELKVGAKVMVAKNSYIEGHVYQNGKIGVIVSIEKDEIKIECNDGIHTIIKATWEIKEPFYTSKVLYGKNGKPYTIKEKKLIGEFTQFPLRMAWAISIEKSQGLTFDYVIADFSALNNKGTLFNYGKIYTALSRCKTYGGLILVSPLWKEDIVVDQRMIDFSEKAKKKEIELRGEIQQIEDYIRNEVEVKESDELNKLFAEGLL